MNLEDQVCSLELAKRLKELGVRQDSYFWHTEQLNKNEKPIYNPIIPVELKDDSHNFYAAFTVAELGMLLPSYRIYTMKYVTRNSWRAKDNFTYISPIQASTEANARAKMLIYLIENNLIKGFHSNSL